MLQQNIQGIGIDIIEVERIRCLSLRWGSRFEHRVYTPQELAYCGKTQIRYARLAARFAAKEATLKALGTGLTVGMNWKDVEVCADAAGKPSLVLHGKVKQYASELGVVTTFVSLSHAVDYAVAQVILCSA
ncbi:holo-[acyl-carrier-protein] synthase [Candidatus Poribacteria bacterium]|nr:MAG: holo-[acyl-carrier-protein] synthase [Candidatus Poribacteria bacterium]